MSEQTPTILLAIADYRTDATKHLRELGNEQDAIEKALKPAIKAGLCQVRRISEATTKKVIDAFSEEENSIVGLHFAGHANGMELLFSQEQSIDRDKFASFLAKQNTLQFVFLNACSTQQHATVLNQKGIPSVIATSQKVKDEVARDIASRFYEGLGKGQTIAGAFSFASDVYNLQKGDYRSVYFQEYEALRDKEPWLLFPIKGSEAHHWSLPLAAENPLFTLPDLPQISLPHMPYLYLRWYDRAHAPVFFGRGADIKRLFDKITEKQSEKVIFLHGQSGIGKSSLLEAGLFPRLEQTYDIRFERREREIGLTQQLLRLLEANTITDLRDKWLTIEANSGKPLLIILDQAEEAFTQPTEGITNEIASLFEMIAALFNEREKAPKGKIMLTFRKEWLAEFRSVAPIYKVTFSSFFLEPLKGGNIREVVTGLTSTTRLQEEYNLTIQDKNLSHIIADDLEEDQNSAIAPVLQILLTKMWQEAIDKNENAPVFTTGDYQSIRSRGILLEDFVELQVKNLQSKFPEEVKSGLVLDLLYFHTTNRGTSGHRLAEEIQERYVHRKDILNELLHAVKGLYLLTNTPTKGKKDVPSTALAHDTLAPLIRAMYEESDLPGQRADRIFRNKITEWTSTTTSEANASWDEKLKSLKKELTEEEVKTLQAGQSGMRAWSEKENRIVEECRAYLKKLKQGRFIRNVVIACFAFLIATSNWFNYQKTHRIKADALFSEGKLLAKIDPTQGLKMMQDGLQKDSDNQNKKLDLWTTYSENLTYKTLYDLPKNSFDKVAFSSDNSLLAYSDTKNLNTIFLCSMDGTSISPIELKGKINNCQDLIFNDDNTAILCAGVDKRVYRWRISDEKMQEYEPGHSVIKQPMKFVRESNKTGQIYGVDKQDRIWIWNSETGILNDSMQFDTKIHSLRIDKNGELLLSIGEEDYRDSRAGISVAVEYKLSDFERNPESDYHNLKNSIQQEKKEVNLMRPKDESLGEKFAQFYRLNEHNLILGSTYSGLAYLWNTETGYFLNSLRGHRYEITSVGLSNDKKQVYTASAKDGKILSWDIPDYSPQYTLSKDQKYPPGIKAVSYSVANNTFIGGDIAGNILSFNPTQKDSPYNIQENEMEISQLVFHPTDVNKYIAADKSGQIKLWQINGQNGKEIIRHNRQVKDIAFSPNGTKLLSGSRDKTVKIHNFSNGSNISVSVEESVIGVAWADENNFVVAGNRGKIWYFDAATETPNLIKTDSVGRSINQIDFIPKTNDLMVTSWEDPSVILYADGSRKVLEKYYSFSWQKDGKYFLGYSADNCAMYLKTKDLYPIRTIDFTFKLEDDSLESYCDGISAIGITEDEKYIYAADAQGQILVWRNDRLGFE